MAAEASAGGKLAGSWRYQVRLSAQAGAGVGTPGVPWGCVLTPARCGTSPGGLGGPRAQSGSCCVRPCQGYGLSQRQGRGPRANATRGERGEAGQRVEGLGDT